MGMRGFDLLDLSGKRNLTVAMLTAHSLNPESLKRSIEMKARAYLPKDKLGEIVPFLETVLEQEYLPGWSRLMKKLEIADTSLEATLATFDGIRKEN
jgi:DNA-binding NarL/FixJ family response regulator